GPYSSKSFRVSLQSSPNLSSKNRAFNTWDCRKASTRGGLCNNDKNLLCQLVGRATETELSHEAHRFYFEQIDTVLKQHLPGEARPSERKTYSKRDLVR